MNVDSKLVAASGLLLTLWLSIFACGKSLSSAGTDSATHWLSRCTTDAECGSLECICGTCTKACTDPASCPSAAVASCAASDASCGRADPVCVADCQTDADCDEVRSGLTCAGGRCRAPEIAPGGGGNGGSAGSDCSALPQCEFACPDGTINPVDTSGCTHTCECVERNCANEPGLPRDGCVPPAPADDCSSIPACRFACPEGTVNPVDENGCTHSCECVNLDTPADAGPVEGDLCGGQVCGPSQFCCGPAECGICAPELSGPNCPTSCGGAGG